MVYEMLYFLEGEGTNLAAAAPAPHGLARDVQIVGWLMDEALTITKDSRKSRQKGKKHSRHLWKSQKNHGKLTAVYI